MSGTMHFKKDCSIPNVPKQNAFSFLRMVCCIAVLYEHAVTLAVPALPCLNVRGIAVDVFFVLSGFWVTVSFLRIDSLRGYAFRRARKILPQYAATVILCAVLLAPFSSLGARSYFFDSGFRKYLAANLCTLNFLCPSLPGVFEGAAVNGSLWTIKVEIGFYVALPILIFLTRKLAFYGGGYKIVLVITYTLSVLYEVLMPVLANAFHLPLEIAHQAPAYFSYFTSGMLFVFAWESLVARLKYIAPMCAAVFAFCTAVEIPFVSAFARPFCLAALVMYLALHLRPFFGAVKTDLSYGIYLSHYPLVLCFASFGVFERNPAFGLFAVLASSFFSAHILECLQKYLFGKREIYASIPIARGRP